MRSFFLWLWNGFGTGTTAGRAVGITICILLSAVIVLYFIVKTIVKLFNKQKADAATRPGADV